MSFNGKKTFYRLAQLLICLCILSSVCSKRTLEEKRGRTVNCRKFVHAPICRGSQAKRDVSGGLEGDSIYNLRGTDISDYYNLDTAVDILPKEDAYGIKNFLMGLLRRNRNLDYDSGTPYTS